MGFIRYFSLLSAIISLAAATRSLRVKRGDGRMGSVLDVDLIVSDIDQDSDGIVSATEYNTFFNNMDTNKDDLVTRCEWTNRFVKSYDDSKLSALASFDIFDVDGNNFVSGAEIDISGYDFDDDGKTTTEELKTGIRKESGLAKETSVFKRVKSLLSVNVPAKAVKSKLKVGLIAKDADIDGDGRITRLELQTHFLANFDQNGDNKVTRCDFVTRSVERYDDMKDVAAVAFDGLDDNKNNFIDINDIKLSKFDEDKDGRLTAEEFESSMRKADWAAIKNIYPGATTPSPMGGSAETTQPIGILLLITVVLTYVH